MLGNVSMQIAEFGKNLTSGLINISKSFLGQLCITRLFSKLKFEYWYSPNDSLFAENKKWNLNQLLESLGKIYNKLHTLFVFIIGRIIVLDSETAIKYLVYILVPWYYLLHDMCLCKASSLYRLVHCPLWIKNKWYEQSQYNHSAHKDLQLSLLWLSCYNCLA